MYPSVWGPIVQFNTFIHDPDGTEQTLSKCADVWDEWLTRQSVVLLSTRYLEPGENGWQEPHEVQLGKHLRPVLVRSNPLCQNKLQADCLESWSAEQNLGVLADSKLDISQQCSLKEKVPIHIPCCSRKVLTTRVRVSLVSQVKRDRTRGKGLPFYQGRFRLDIGKNCFTGRAAKH